MPTPFTHLHYAQRAFRDPALPDRARALLAAHLPEFLLGSVVVDAQGGAGLSREATHFYSYDRPITPMPWEAMFERYPGLRHPEPPAAQAYLAGYVFHLAMDAYWTLNMTAPNFGQAHWGTRASRFLMLHVLMVEMDTRDFEALDPAFANALNTAAPGDWLPFLPLPAVRWWQNLVGDQVRPGGIKQTYEVMAPRVGLSPEALRTLMSDEAVLARELWAHVPRALIRQVESEMYAFSQACLKEFLQHF